MVGWNWMNSMSLTATPAHSASATPSPVEPSGLVVALYRWPSPPVARMTAGACTMPGPSALLTRTPVTVAPSCRISQRDVIAPDVQRGGGVVERPLHLGAGRVAAGVDDAPPRVPAFAGQRPLAGRGFVEMRSEVDQFGDGGVPVGDDRANRGRIAQATAGGQGVVDMRLDRVVGSRQHHRDTALGVERGGLRRLAQHHHPATQPLRRQRRGQPRHPGADDDDVGTLLPET